VTVDNHMLLEHATPRLLPLSSGSTTGNTSFAGATGFVRVNVNQEDPARDLPKSVANIGPANGFDTVTVPFVEGRLLSSQERCRPLQEAAPNVLL